MSAVIMRGGNIQTHEVTVVCIRWGGGADVGKTHVFVSSAGGCQLGRVSMQCVTDDFGDLVEVAA